MENTLEQVNERLEALQAKAQGLMDAIENGGSEADVKSLKEKLEGEVAPALEELQAERADRVREAEMEALRGKVTTLSKAIEELRAPAGFDFGVPSEAGEGERVYGEKSLHSFFSDIRSARRGDHAAQERLLKGKAMTEGTDSAGGYLVAPEISSELITLREQGAVVRSLCSKVNVQSDTVQIASVTGGLTAGWVAELAAKPSADMTFGQISTSVFTAAGLAVVSNQLLADSRPSVDGLAVADLAKRLATVEEVAFINGSGTGQPLGILNTSGVNSVPYTDASPTVPELLDVVVDAITAVQTNYQGNPTHILMHPRTWAWIVKAREASSPSTYLIGAGSTAFGRRASDPLPAGELFGLPVVLTKNIPTNLGAGTNESRVIVGNFSEALILDRQGVTVDESPHVYFTTNQTVFRAEERVGFTAGRYPKAFSVIGGTGLANN